MGVDIIKKHFPLFTDTQMSSFTKLGDLYLDWNQKINLISRKDTDYLYERHILHSLGILKVRKMERGTEVLDVGTGGGLPGIPLAIALPNVQFTLVDSIGKKIKVVNEIVNHLELDNVKALNARAESIDNSYDYIVSRAVTQMGPFVRMIYNQTHPGTRILALKGGDLGEELKTVRQKHRVHPLKKYFDDEFYLTKKVVEVKL